MRIHGVAMIGLIALATASVAQEQKGIDLDCAQHGQRLVERIQQEQVVMLNDAQAAQIRQICMELCQGAETEASAQQEAVLRNWFFSDQTGGKAGNERLKKLK